jgi:hypothetical protein
MSKRFMRVSEVDAELPIDYRRARREALEKAVKQVKWPLCGFATGKDANMEIVALRAHITEQDLNDLIRKHVRRIEPVEDLRVHLIPAGLVVEGVYPLFVSVKFEALWELNVLAGKLTARLADLRALGISATLFRPIVLKLVADAVRAKDWLQVDDDSVVIDVDRLLAEKGIPAQTNLRGVACGSGTLLLEAGAPAPDARS